MKMKMKTINKNHRYSIFFIIFCIQSCTLSPGMHMTPSGSWIDADEYTYIESIQKKVKIKNINSALSTSNNYEPYRIGNGDQISITVWGLQDVFPMTNINVDQNLRRVDSNGDIFFPYIGSIKAQGKTAKNLRDDITEGLSEFFNNPQLDVSIARFNSQRIYILGEVTRPLKINISDVPLSLSEALGQANGLNTNTSDAAGVYIIRQGESSEDPEIFKANLASPAGFVDAGSFYLDDNDIIYVNAKGITRWNRVISQFFPFSSFLNSIDNLVTD